MFPHGLSGNPLFELPSLLALAKRMPDHRDTYWSNGRVDVTDTWARTPDGRLTLEDTIKGIHHNNSLVILKHTEQDKVFGPALQRFLELVVEFCGDAMRGDVIVGEVLILISSPNRITPFHVDAETNFLVQIIGDKTVCLFDQKDPDVITHDEKERFFRGDFNSAVYSEMRQAKATTYDLRAGYGIHIPVFAPHWVRNHGNISVALSVNYELHSVAKMADVYQANRYLRTLGLAPATPGSSTLRDNVKSAAIRGMRATKRLLRP